eukprot:CAMPEP_0183562694 /NCGR_PEP_ID=MMETSP0371-20130417/98635_1 /TAXON_ID=268820 /ORGANISM="Peridinium aciculiferum, Strain PAER-2" /LENGTH=40 /DNA_ID= /DNA_START= /DNA_END= /DNA_ORIENTATION=
MSLLRFTEGVICPASSHQQALLYRLVKSPMTSFHVLMSTR